MNIRTKYFGEIQIDETNCITFPQGMPGFHAFQRYLLIPFDNEDDSLLCLQSLDEPELAFTILNPFYVEPDYAPRLTDDDLAALHSSPDTALAFYSIAVLREPFSDTTVNLKCPLAINLENQLAIQVVMEDDRYSMRHRLSPIPSPSQSSGKED